MLQIPEKILKDILVKEGVISPEAFDEVANDAKRLSQGLSDLLISKSFITSNFYNNLLSTFINVPFANIIGRVIDVKLLNLIPEALARQKRAILFGEEPDGSYSIAFEDPTDLGTIAFFERYLNRRIKPYLASTSDLNKGFSLYGKSVAEDYKKIIEKNVRTSIETKSTGEKAATDLPIVEMINNLISYALSLRASDIHMEVFDDLVLIRYRIDGILHEVLKIPKEAYPAIIARIKLLSGMKIDEHLKPQDGRFRYQIGSDVVDIRVAVLPTFYGEKVEMRLLSGTTRPLSFSELGMLPETIKTLEENIRKSYGMIVICGPTGSGKSTTLYSILSVLNRPEVNIVTVEDPIEYDMKFVNQTQVNTQAGINFASGLRAILRQDPNVIMVGETRDPETADISVQAALTGHMVLTSLHTNDAPTAIPRFLDMKVPPFLVSSVLNLVLAQRLVRRICRNCAYSYEPSPEILAIIEKEARSVGVSSEFQMPKVIYAGRGCDVCNGTGYVGRMGIFEALNVTANIRAYIIDPNFSLDGLKMLARQEGMIGMFEDGMRKVERGWTTVEELLRVIRE